MANYAAAVLLEAQLILNERLNAPEKRLKAGGAMNAFMKNTEFSVPNIGDLRAKEERPEGIHFMNRSKRTNATFTRTHNHTGTVGDSTKVATAWKTFGDKCQTSLKRADNNVYTDAQMLANELDNIFKNIHEDIDAHALTQLGTMRTQVNGATKGGTWSAANNTWQIAAANKDRFIQQVKSMMRQNYYNGQYDLVADSLLFGELEFRAAQGGGNATNLGFQYGGVDIMENVKLTDANYANGVGYMIGQGTIGVVDWIPTQNRQGRGSYDTVLGGYGSIVDPITGLSFAVHGYSGRADTSGAGGDTQDDVLELEVSIDLSFNKAPLTVANESTVFQVGQL